MNEIIELIKINRHIKIYKNHNFISPMIMGYFHPIILLPDIEFTYEELKCILLHEVIHYKYKHIFFKFFVFILRSILWWNPLMYLWSDEINNILEYQTDRKVCSLLNIKEQTHYLNGIIKVIDNISADVKLPYASVGLIESDSEKVIIRRFKFILGNVYSSSSKLKSALLIIFFIICFLSSYLIVLQPYSEPTNENYNDNAPIISSDAYIKKTDNSYTIFTADGKEIATYSGEISEKYNYLEIKEE